MSTIESIYIGFILSGFVGFWLLLLGAWLTIEVFGSPRELGPPQNDVLDDHSHGGGIDRKAA